MCSREWFKWIGLDTSICILRASTAHTTHSMHMFNSDKHGKGDRRVRREEKVGEGGGRTEERRGVPGKGVKEK